MGGRPDVALPICCGRAAGRRWSSRSWGRWRSGRAGAGAGAGGQGAGPAGRPAGPAGPGGVGGPAGRGPVGRRPAREPGQHPPGSGVGPAPGAGTGRGGAGGDPAARLRPGGRPGHGRRGPVRAAGRRGRAGPAPAAAAPLLREALGLWRGPALAEFADQPWAQAEAARLEELRLAAVEALVERRLAAGEHTGLVGELEGLVAAHPTRERLRGQLMVALYRSGRQADALERLPGRPGGPGRGAGDRPVAGAAAAAPGRSCSRTRPLRRRPRGRHGRGTTCPSGSPAWSGGPRSCARWPSWSSSTGWSRSSGRAGPARPAWPWSWAGGWWPGYPDGVWLVELAALRDPALLGEAVAATLGLSGEAAGPEAPPPAAAERLAGFVADKGLLLVLDNCEHLVEACRRAGPAAAAGWPGAAGAGHQPRGPGRARGGGLAGPAPGRPRPRRGRLVGRRPGRGRRRAGRPGPRGAGRLRRRAAVRGAGQRRRPGLRAGRGQRAGGGRAVPAPGRAAAGHRAGRGPGPGPAAGRAGGPPGRPLPAPGRRRPGQRPAPADPPGDR